MWHNWTEVKLRIKDREGTEMSNTGLFQCVLYKVCCCMPLLQYFPEVLVQFSLCVIQSHEYLCLNDAFDCNFARN